MKKNLSIAQTLRRELKGKVLSRVAQDLGISVSLLHDWYRSGRVPSGKNLWQLKKLADYLGLTMDELLFEDASSKNVVGSLTFVDRGIQYRIHIEKLKRE